MLVILVNTLKLWFGWFTIIWLVSTKEIGKLSGSIAVASKFISIWFGLGIFITENSGTLISDGTVAKFWIWIWSPPYTNLPVFPEPIVVLASV